MNSGDVFVYDSNSIYGIFVWSGCATKRSKRVKGAQVAMDLRKLEHGGRGHITHIQEHTTREAKEKNLSPDAKRFWSLLGGHPLAVGVLVIFYVSSCAPVSRHAMTK